MGSGEPGMGREENDWGAGEQATTPRPHGFSSRRPWSGVEGMIERGMVHKPVVLRVSVA